MPTYTALYDKRDHAESAQRELAALGIIPVAHLKLSDKNSEGFVEDRAADNRSFWESLKDIFVSHEDRPVYEEGLRRGGWLLTVNADDESAQQVHELLERSHAVDIDEREADYRQAAERVPADQGAADRGAADQMRVMEERLQVGKRKVDVGGVRVRSYIVEKPVEQTVSLRDDHIVVERHPADRAITVEEAADALRARSVELRAAKEELVVAKEARVVEEISVQKEVDERVEHVGDTVRRTEVEVERLSAESDPDLSRR